MKQSTKMRCAGKWVGICLEADEQYRWAVQAQLRFMNHFSRFPGLTPVLPPPSLPLPLIRQPRTCAHEFSYLVEYHRRKTIMHPLYHLSPLYSAADTERPGLDAHKAGDHRDPFERDRARIIHSFSFRRLQSKTQIFSLNESAFLRTRLTHSLEVANIGRGLTAVLNRQIWPGFPLGNVKPEYEELAGVIDTSLIEAACLAHDLGHPPFGHRGEEALNFCVWTRLGDNGFEGNGQTLRLLNSDDLEVHGDHHGLNLTRTVLQAILKYPRIYGDLVNPLAYPTNAACPPFKPWAPPKCIHNEEQELLDWILSPFSPDDRERLSEIEYREGRHARTRNSTLEASVVELADDIAYGTHDVEDAFFSRLIEPEAILSYLPKEKFQNPATQESYASLIVAMGRGGGASRRDAVHEKKQAASALIGRLIGAAELTHDIRFEHPRLRWRATLPHDHRLTLEALKRSVYDLVINGPAVQSLEYRGGIIIRKMFDAFIDSPELLSGKHGHLLREADTEAQRVRVLADFISGMTDNYAERMYNRLFQPGSGSVFDRL
jgi:dGTPase